MKLTSLLVAAPLAALISFAIGFPALPVFALATVAFLLALALESYQPQRIYASRALSRPRRLAQRSRRARLPLAA